MACNPWNSEHNIDRCNILTPQVKVSTLEILWNKTYVSSLFLAQLPKSAHSNQGTVLIIEMLLMASTFCKEMCLISNSGYIWYITIVSSRYKCSKCNKYIHNINCKTQMCILLWCNIIGFPVPLCILLYYPVKCSFSLSKMQKFVPIILNFLPIMPGPTNHTCVFSAIKVSILAIVYKN